MVVALGGGAILRRLMLRLLFAVPLWANAAVAAPITFNTALPVAKGEFIFREQYVVEESGDDPSGADRERGSRALVSVLGYGLTPKLAIFGVLPYLDNELKLTTGGQRVTRRANGFGDLTSLARYTAVQRDQPGRTFRLAPFAGVKAPTGDDDARDALGPLPPDVQVGSGSWDAFAGIAATYQTLRYQIDGQVSLRANSEANDFEAGDEVRLDASLQYRLSPRQLTSGVPAFVYGVIEANLVDRGENRLAGRKDTNSGGTTFFLTPGVQYVTKRWIFEAGVQIPVSQNLNGTALENDFIARLSFRANF